MPSPSWDVVADVQLLLQFPFMQNAFAAGTLVAIVAGATGYFVVLRGQTFATHMLSQVGFPGAAAAVLLQLPAVVGLVAFCLVAAASVGALGRDVEPGRRTESAAVASILALALGAGFLLFRLYGGSTSGIYGLLFGSILGITGQDVALTAALAAAAILFLAAIGRPLVFASVDPDVARARGVPVRALAAAFLAVLALAVAIAVQIVGTLLTFALLAVPAAVALQVTPRPGRAVAVAVALALAFTWSGLALAYFTDLPVGFYVTTVAFATYVGVRLVSVATRAMLSAHPPGEVTAARP